MNYKINDDKTFDTKLFNFVYLFIMLLIAIYIHSIFEYHEKDVEINQTNTTMI